MKRNFIAAIVILVTEFVAIIAGIVVGLTSNWLTGVLTYVIIASVGGLLGGLIIINMMKVWNNPSRLFE